MNWLPHFYTFGTCLAERDFEAEGRGIQIVVGPFVFEVSLSKIDRDFREEHADAR